MDFFLKFVVLLSYFFFLRYAHIKFTEIIYSEINMTQDAKKGITSFYASSYACVHHSNLLHEGNNNMVCTIIEKGKLNMMVSIPLT